MPYLSVKEAIQQRTGQVSIRGWIHRERKSNQFAFLIVRDSTDIIQCIVEREKVSPLVWNDATTRANIEASVALTGCIRQEKRAPTGYEISVDHMEIVGDSHDFPITRDQSTEFLLDMRHLWLRSRKMTAIMKIRSTTFGAIHEYFRSHGFYEYHSPIFQSVQCEGGSTLFKVDYFESRDVFLAQTWQLYAEPAIFALEKIYTIAPSFRAEKSKTSRHLTEYWHAEMEAAWASFDDIQNHGEELIRHIVKKVLKENGEELAMLNRDVKKLEPAATNPFIRMTYDDALHLLKEKCKMDVEWGKDLRTIEEDALSRAHDTPLIVTNYPKAVKAFYMKENPKNPQVVHGCDFIAPEGYGEIIGGSEREPDITAIEKRLREQGEDPKQYQFYLDTRKYGSVPHAGFGLGVERIIAWICGLDNIKDAIPFPRTMLRKTP